MESCVCGCDGVACIPQREYERPRTDPLSAGELQEIIPFSVNGTCGYPLNDALKKQYTGLDGRDDKMFINCKSSISIRLEVCLSASAQSNNGPESCYSGCRTRSGRSRSVPTPTFHCMEINEPYRFER